MQWWMMTLIWSWCLLGCVLWRSVSLVWILVDLGTYHFLPNRGHEKLGGHKIFSWKIGGNKSNQEIIWWPILLKIVQWNNPQNAYFPHYIVGTYFFNIVAPEGDGHKNFNHWVRGRKNIGELLLEIHDPPIPKKMVASFVMVVNVVTQCLFPPNKCPNIRTAYMNPTNFYCIWLYMDRATIT